jgi:hypothetical protein
VRGGEKQREGVALKGGCLKTVPALIVLVAAAPPALALRHWRQVRRGGEVRSSIDVQPFMTSGGRETRRIDLTIDVSQKVEADLRRRITDTIVRVAEKLRDPGDVYHLVYRLPWDEEPVLMPVGPKIQELGERLSLTFSQSTLARRTAVWLSLDSDRALSEVVDPANYDPEAEGEPEALIAHADARWAMATSWARVGPSLIVRLILFVPTGSADRVIEVIEPLR